MPETTADISTLRFTANDLHKRDGMATWREVIGRTLIRLDLSLLAGSAFHHEVKVRVLPNSIGVAFAANAGMRMERTRDLLKDGSDDLVLYVCRAGRLSLMQRQRQIDLDSGQAALLSHAEAGFVAFPSLARQLLVRVPRRMLASFVSAPEDCLARPITPSDGSLRLLAGYCESLEAGAAPATPGLQRLLATHIRDLVAVTIGANGDGAELSREGGIRAARLRAIKDYVVRRLEDGALSLTAAAAHHQVSPRYVQTLFEREGTTFSAYVLKQRLSCAYRLLTKPWGARRTVADIAFAVGFGDLSYFNRSFRRQYGATPSDVRAAAVAVTSGESWTTQS